MKDMIWSFEIVFSLDGVRMPADGRQWCWKMIPVMCKVDEHIPARTHYFSQWTFNYKLRIEFQLNHI